MAVQKIRKQIGEVISLSAFYATAPWGFSSDNTFLNAALCVDTALAPLEKAQTYGFRELKSYDTVRSVVQMKFLDMGRIADVDELLEETDLIYKGMCELVVKNKTEEILDEIKQRGIAFDDLSVIEKARMLQFQPDNNSYNIQLYSAVCKACGVDTSDEDKIFEDYQAIYEKTLAMEQEQVMGRNDGGRERAR